MRVRVPIAAAVLLSIFAACDASHAPVSGDGSAETASGDPSAVPGPGEPAAEPTSLTTTARWQPAQGTSWQIQLQGTLDTTVPAEIFVIDLFDNTAETIASLHAAQRRVICYFSAGSYEDWRPDASAFPDSVKGNSLDGWPGEWWLDIRAPVVRDIMAARMDLAVSKGCDGVDPDNVDGYTNDTGFPLTGADQLAYNRFLAAAAHERGLAVGLKNDLDQVQELVADFDWAMNEECFRYAECGTLQPFIDAGKPVFQIEYGGMRRAERICPKSLARGFDTLIKKLSLGAWRISCR